MHGIGINEANLPGLRDSNTPKEGHQKVELFISCRNLKNRDIRSLSDPRVKLYALDKGNEKLLGETEVIRDNLNPNFIKTFTLDYIFEVKQPLCFKVLDIDANGKFNIIGELRTTMGEIMGSRNQVLINDITNENKKTGKIILRTEIIDGIQAFANIQINGKKLKNYAGFFSKGSPFFQLSRAHEEATNIVVYQSSIIRKNLNPTWPEFQISLKTLCNNDRIRPIQCSVYHKKQHMGQCNFSINDVLNQEIRQFTLKKPKSATKTYGTIEINKITVQERPSFLEYLRRGIQINVMTAIDFTASNGNPKSSVSLHAFKSNGRYNDYQSAIHGVSEILLCYDYDKHVPVYGFGGKPQGSTEVSHCFPLTGNERENYAYGLDGIMGLYKNALENVSLSGPTYFKGILRKGIDIARRAKEEGSVVYTVLLILTDGIIHDMQPTIDCLYECSELPISVIIVGVGNEDFTLMETLDNDSGQPLCNSKGERLKRDVVQFVAFNKFKGDKEALAEQVLAEVPRQLIEYMQAQGIDPKIPEKFDINKMVFSPTADEQVQYGGF